MVADHTTCCYDVSRMELTYPTASSVTYQIEHSPSISSLKLTLVQNWKVFHLFYSEGTPCERWNCRCSLSYQNELHRCRGAADGFAEKDPSIRTRSMERLSTNTFQDVIYRNPERGQHMGQLKTPSGGLDLASIGWCTTGWCTIADSVTSCPSCSARGHGG